MTTISMASVRAIYASKQPDGHWFDRGTLKFFGSRLPRNAKVIGDKAYFVSSEYTGFRKEGRAYSVRSINLHTGEIDTVGEFLAYSCADDARAAIKAIARGAQ